MRAGDLRKRIALEQRSTTQDSAGEPANTWTLYCLAWASLEQLSGRELESAQTIANEVSHQVVMRYQPGITADMRVNYAGRYFNILAVLDEEERHRQLTLMCQEGLAQG